MVESEGIPTSFGGLTCIQDDCDINDNSTFCSYRCFPSITSFPVPQLPPQPPPPPPSPSQSHAAPFLIAIVSILGISFLLLTTCTIILRVRFTRRRQGGSTPDSGDPPVSDEDDAFVDHPIWHITTVGLQQSVIDSITAFKYKKIDGFFVEGNDSSCSVCLTEFEDGDDLRLLPKCSHAFHVSCIDTWLRSHKNCPLCRAPIVNDSLSANSAVEGVNSSNSGVLRVNLDEHDVSSNGGEGSSRQGDDVLGSLPMLEGIKIAEVLRKNRELRVFSDLGQNHRFRGVEDDDGGLEPVRRSVSFNAVVASSNCGAMMGSEGCSCEGRFSEGSSRDGGNVGDVLQEKNIDEGKGGKTRGSSMSGILVKSSSIGRSLQKGPVSMKRSLSSSSKFFSFRKSKSQASVLPFGGCSDWLNAQEYDIGSVTLPKVVCVCWTDRMQ